MKFESKSRKDVLFDTVETGEVIRFNHRILLVIEEVTDSEENFCNAIDVKSGEPAFISGNDEVEVLNVVLKEL